MTTDTQPDQLMSVRTAAALLAVDEQTVRRLVDIGELIPVRIRVRKRPLLRVRADEVYAIARGGQS